MVKPFIPKGCDQQGRFPEAFDTAPAPAEAATELGVDEPDDTYGALIIDVTISIMLLAVVAAIVLTLVGA